jgi:hypothetical protein
MTKLSTHTETELGEDEAVVCAFGYTEFSTVGCDDSRLAA